MGEELPKTRKQALEQGVTQYFTGKPCKFGHVAPRFTHNRNCKECVHRRNRKRTKNNYWTEYGDSDAYKEKKRAYAREWYEQNKDRKDNYSAKRREYVKRATVGSDEDQIKVKKIHLRARLLSLETGIPHEVDHIIPLIHPLVSGLHTSANLQILTREDNKAKGARFIPEEHEWKKPSEEG